MFDWDEMIRAIRADFIRLRAHVQLEGGGTPFFRLGLVAAVLHRLSHYLYRRGWRLPARFTWLTNILLTGADIDNAARIGKGLVLVDPRSVIIYGNAGDNCTFMGRCGIGGTFDPENPDIGAGRGRAVLLDGVTLGFGSTVLGPVTVGQNVEIGPNRLVTKTVAEAKVVQHEGQYINRDFSDAHSPAAAAPKFRQLPLRDVLYEDYNRFCIYLAEAGDKYAIALFQSGYIAVALHRIAYCIWAANLYGLARLTGRINWLITGVDLDPASEIGPGLLIPIPSNVVCMARLGKNCTLFPDAVVRPLWKNKRRATSDEPPSMPRLGDEVEIGVGAHVIGPVHIGHGARIGSRRLIVQDVANAEYVPPSSFRILLPDRRTHAS